MSSDTHGVARDQLRAFVERIERLEEEKKTIADDIKDVYGEAKSLGFDTKILKMVISLRKKDEQQRTEEEIILGTYLQALGMIPTFVREEDKPVTANEVRSASTDAPETPGKQCTSVVSRDEAGQNLTGTPNFDPAPASQGEADAPSVERVRPTGSAAANVGGDHVTETPRSADIRPGLVSNPPAYHPLRPNCKNPGSQCAGYGSKLCHACAVAVRELETA